jgi:TRAP-type uncharacterized transport system substrate-binding protein
MHLARAKSLMAGGFALLAFVAALAAGTAGAPAFGGLSWVMVTAGALGVVYVAGAALAATLVDLRTHHAGRNLHPATVVSSRGGTPRSTAR